MKEVGVRIKVGASGTENVDKLASSLKGAEAGAAALDGKAGALSSEMQRLSQAEQAAAGSATALAGASGTASNALRQQDAAAKQARSGLDDLGRQISVVRNLAQAAIGGQLLGGLVGEVSKTADAYSNLAGRIKLVTGEGAAFDAAFQGVFDIATRTNSSLEATGNLFARIAQAGKDIGVSQEAALQLTETINQAVQLSGASAEGSSAAITQLIQGLQSGVLRGDEFNSVMEQSPRLAKALADGLGTTTGELRKMAEAGALSAQTVISALQGQSVALQQEFNKLPPTVGRALQNLQTEWTRYVGEVDKANGISEAAARAIRAVAENLDTLGNVLATAGKAFAAYTALRVAQTFNDKARAVQLAAAALAEETAATVVNTAATASNTAAKRANALSTQAAAAGMTSVGKAATGAAAGVEASAAGATAAAGRFAALRVVALRVVSMLGVIGAAVAAASLAWDGLKAVGNWIGGTTDKLAGYRDRTKELALASEDAAKAGREEAAVRAQYAQQTQLAAERALGLNDASRKLVASFDDMRTKGSSASEALEKLAKDLDLGSVQGINDAITALDALAQKGRITGEQVAQSLSKALDGKDLAIFETTARVAFDGTEQGVRRLQAALEAVADQSLKRVGTSAQELQTGFSAAMNIAINDTDALAKTLDDMGIKGDQAGQLLAKSIDKEIEAAKTEKALELVKLRLVEMGNQGKQSGDLVVAGLDKIQKKADELKPGINSVAEAARKLGIQVQTDMSQTADSFKKSWDIIRNSTEVGLAEKIKGFARYREAAIAANGGVESSEVALQREILETQSKAEGLGVAFERAMGGAERAAKQVKRYFNELGEETDKHGNAIAGIVGIWDGVTAATKRAEEAALRYGSVLKSTQYDAEKFALSQNGQRFEAGGGQGDLPGSGRGPSFWIGQGMSPGVTQGDGFALGQGVRRPATAAAAGPVGGGGSRTININLSNGQRSSVALASAGDADRLEFILKSLEQAKGMAGY